MCLPEAPGGTETSASPTPTCQGPGDLGETKPSFRKNWPETQSRRRGAACLCSHPNKQFFQVYLGSLLLQKQTSLGGKSE